MAACVAAIDSTGGVLLVRGGYVSPVKTRAGDAGKSFALGRRVVLKVTKPLTFVSRGT